MSSQIYTSSSLLSKDIGTYSIRPTWLDSMLLRGALPNLIAHGTDIGQPLLPDINTLFFDPVSIITLFFDAAEKDLVAKSGDLNMLTWFGLFVNPTTVWCEYGTLHPNQGLRYYVPDEMLTSTVEVAQVHDFLLRLARGCRNCGIVIQLQPQPSSQFSSWKTSPWVWLARPILPCILLITAGLSLDFWAFGAIGCLLLGQTMGIAQTRFDSWQQRDSGDPGVNGQVTTIFLANNVTIVVQSLGDLFKQAVSSIDCRKLEKPVFVEMLTILIFMAGVLMVGFSQTNFKVTYLLGHAVQAVLIAPANASKLNKCSVNRVTWQVQDDKKVLGHRRDAYIWVTRKLKSRQVDWLKELIHNPNSLVEDVRQELQKDVENQPKSTST